MNDIVKNEAQQIAQTILNQLGGSKFIAMTGARVSYQLNDKSQPVLVCRLPRDFAKDKIILFRVTYNYETDLYNLDFSSEVKLIKSYEHIWFDDLIRLFELETGLYCSL